MARRIVDIDGPERCVVRLLGGGDDETYILSASREGRVVSVALERDGLAALAERIMVFVDELERRGLVAIETGTPAPVTASSTAPRVELVAGTLVIAWDDDADRVIVEVHAMPVDPGAGERAALPQGGHDAIPDDIEVIDDDPLGPDVVRLRLAPIVAQRLARGARAAMTSR